MRMRTRFGVACAAGLAAAAVMAQNPFAGLPKSERTGKTTITSDKLEFDYKDYVALFEGHVKVVDPQFTLTANKMLVFFENTNDVRRLDAIGNVKVVSGDRTATCGKATYTRANGAIVLQEQPVVTKGPNTIRGGSITVWIGDSRVEVNDAVQLEGTVGSK